jgi:hypothetical protein
VGVAEVEDPGMVVPGVVDGLVRVRRLPLVEPEFIVDPLVVVELLTPGVMPLFIVPLFIPVPPGMALAPPGMVCAPVPVPCMPPVAPAVAPPVAPGMVPAPVAPVDAPAPADAPAPPAVCAINGVATAKTAMAPIDMIVLRIDTSSNEK